MKNFETYNPEIEDNIPTRDESSLTYSDEPLPTHESAHSRQARTTLRKNSATAKGNKKTKTIKKRQAELPNTGFADDMRQAASLFGRIFNSAGMKLFIGSVFGLCGIWLLVSFISFLATGFHDNSEIASTAIGQAQSIKNSGGELGARISEFLINDCFGLGALVIIFWLFATSLNMFRILKFRAVNFFIKCLIALLAVSLIVGLLTISLDTSFNWGGNHGRYINEELLHLTGWYGALLVCLLTIIAFVAICLNDLRVWVLKLKAEHDERKRIQDEKRAEEEARRQQIRDLAEIEEHSKDAQSEDEISQTVSEIPVSFKEEDSPSLTYVGVVEDFEQTEQPDENDSSRTLQKPTDNETQDEADTQNDTSEELNTSSNATATPDISTDVMKVNVNNIEDVVNGEKRPDIYDPTAELSHYKFPPYELLRDAKTRISVDQEEQIENKERIRKTLLNFDIPIVSIEATVGPTVTLYEIVPDKGVRISKIRNLVDDIALRLAAKGVRIIAPIPGKGTVGIEVANKDPQTVSMRTVIRSRKYQETKYELPIALGSTISGDVYISDLAKMPHLLVAGATGQGKSVGLNAIIASLLYRKHPAELKFVLIDPKMVEFSLYSAISDHYLAKLPDEEDAIITDPQKVVATLNSLCIEMDARYELLKAANVRKITEYNAKFIGKHLNPEKGHRYLPYIVVIVDEFSDLIMTAGKEVEMPIARIAQKARAVGIHMIIATQRPSTNVITGVIKANFPARMAFKVSSGVDSKTILDTTGAQQLIGRGDMLLSNNSEMERVQCAFIDTPEVEAICKHIQSQPSFGHPYLLPEPPMGGDGGTSSEAYSDGGGLGVRDPLFEEVARMVVNSNTASTSSLQRRYRIGYNRAGNIMDQLEEAGIVGPAQGGKPRAVLVDPMTLESILS